MGYLWTQTEDGMHKWLIYGHRQETECSGKMPKVTDTRETPPARCRRSRTQGKMLRQDADGFLDEGKCSGKMPMAFRIMENAMARCRWLFGRGKHLRQDADGFSDENHCSGKMPMAFWTKETAPATVFLRFFN